MFEEDVLERLTKIEQLFEKLVGRRSETNMTAVIKNEESDPLFNIRIHVKLDVNTSFYSTMG